MQAPVCVVSGDAAARWHGNDERIAGAVVTAASMSAGIPDILGEAAPPGIPEIGMTAAMAPDRGSHASIQTNTNLRGKLMSM